METCQIFKLRNRTVFRKNNNKGNFAYKAANLRKNVVPRQQNAVKLNMTMINAVLITVTWLSR